MTTELFYLTLTSIWLATMWAPFIAGAVRHDGENMRRNLVTPRNPATLPPWVQRANRAHVNLVEQFGPYAVLIITLHMMGVSDAWTVGAAAAFFWLRVAHAGVMWAGVSVPVRPMLFTGCWVSILILAWRALAA